jgi:guanosine-3',5'-bis(diphosphate) 3'-pyrophosphohydrolase
MLELARTRAEMAHLGQKYGDEPYIAHCERVVEVLRRFGFEDEHLLAAGYLHDTLEDTHLTKDRLVNEFGQRVADLVDACTDGPGRNRKARKERPFRLIPKTPGALAVKLADRITNVESSGKKLAAMYRKEHPVFLSRLYDDSDPRVAAMFVHLKGLIR